MTSSLPPPTLVQDGSALARLLEDLDGQGEIAFDTEADSFFNFREKVCLIQVTVEDRDYLVDPLAGLDLSGLGRVLADPGKTKVFHDGEYDILILKRDFGFEFAGLFDTRVAAAALGSEAPGLASVLKSRFDVKLDKSMQRSNWSARPLSDKQIRYARLDTRFLIPLMHEQRPDLEARGRMMVVEGECRRLEQLVPSEPVFEPDDFVRIKGARTLDLQAQQCLRELFILRQELAQRADLPPFKIFGNRTLMDLATQQPRSENDLPNASGMSARQVNRLGRDVLRAIRAAQKKGPLKRTPSGRRDGLGLSETEYELHERLKTWRKERAAREGYDASLVVNRHLLTRLAKAKPRDLDALRRVEGIQDWQIESMGDEITRLLADSLDEFSRNGLPRTNRRRKKN